MIRVDATALEPGEAVTGVASGDGRGTLVISLLWYTSGRGTEDVRIVAQERHPAEGAVEVPFRFVMPEQPWSFSGTLITLHWAIEASIEPRGHVVREEIVCAPGRAEIRL